MAMTTRSAASLEQILCDYFEVPVAVEQFVGAWYAMEPENRCRIGEESGYSEQLGWGAVVGKYPDGTPAIVEGTSGKGWVILCGVHPEAPANWRQGMTFTTPATASEPYTADAPSFRMSM